MHYPLHKKALGLSPRYKMVPQSLVSIYYGTHSSREWTSIIKDSGRYKRKQTFIHPSSPASYLVCSCLITLFSQNMWPCTQYSIDAWCFLQSHNLIPPFLKDGAGKKGKRRRNAMPVYHWNQLSFLRKTRSRGRISEVYRNSAGWRMWLKWVRCSIMKKSNKQIICDQKL